jgi:UDP-N-acetylmuramate: L-alanyl-gamma-D-glutamyl-meso-diaminopimelate ligase
LELVKKNGSTAMYKDFAHSPSKLKATTNALKEQYDNRTLVACMELHTFSSLNETFLKEYDGAMAAADEAFVYFNPHTLEHKKLPPITPEQVRAAFGEGNITVFTNSAELLSVLEKKSWQQANLLMMSSGNFDGIDYVKLAERIIP